MAKRVFKDNREWTDEMSIDLDRPVSGQTIDGLFARLRKAITADDPTLVCHWGRELVTAALLSPSSKLWTPDREKMGLQYLEEAMGITDGTKYETNCLRRPDELREAIQGLRREDAAWSALLGSDSQKSSLQTT